MILGTIMERKFKVTLESWLDLCLEEVSDRYSSVCVCLTLKELPVNISNIYNFFVVVTLSSKMLWHVTECVIIFILFYYFLFYLFIYFVYFTILYWFCHTLTWIHHRCTWVPNPEPPSHHLPLIISLGHPSASVPSILHPVLNLD